MKLKQLAFVLSVAWCAMAQGLNTGAFGKRIELTFNQSGESMPIAVRLAEGEVEGFAYADCAEGGADLRATWSDGTELPLEIERWNTAGESLLWVRVPAFQTGDTAILYYNNPAPETAPESSLVWDGFSVVHHLNARAAAPGSASVSDLVNMTFVEAVLGLGAKTVSTANGGFAFTASEVAAAISETSRFTISMVVKAANNPPAHGTRFATNKTSYDKPGFDVMYFSTGDFPKKITVRGDNANKTAHFDASGIDWTQPHHLAIVFDGATCACYVDGKPLSTTSAAIDPVTTHANTLYLGKGTGNGTALSAIYDEFRLRDGTSTAAAIACEYADLMTASLYTRGAAILNSDTFPVFDSTPAIAYDGTRFTLSAALAKGSATLTATVTPAGHDPIEFPMGAATAGKTLSVPLDGLPEETLCTIRVTATNAQGETFSVDAPNLYTGAVALELVQPANEAGLVNGIVRFTRAATEAATAGPLTLPLACSGEAQAGVHYRAIPQSVTIPAGEASVELAITPINCAETQVDVTLLLTLSGAPCLPTAAPLSVPILNLTVPEGFNVWLAPEAGVASNPDNWSQGRAPIETDAVLFDGRFSVADCTWDAPQAVASWTQRETYTGTVTVGTAYSGDFQTLSIAGDLILDGGAIAHLTNADSARYRLKLAIGGNLSVGINGTLDARNRGLGYGKTYSGGLWGIHAGSNGSGTVRAVRGSLEEPSELGAGGFQNAQWHGGGAIWIECQGDARLDGTADVHVTDTDNTYFGDGTGAPGSFYLKAASLSGSGKILANAPQYDLRAAQTPSGGRVAIHLTRAETMAFPTDHITLHGALSSTPAGSGTLFVKTPATPHGELYLDAIPKTIYAQYNLALPDRYGSTPIPAGETWTLDAIHLRRAAILRLPKGTTLSLPNGLISVTGESERCGIILDGGTLQLPDGDQTLATDWVLHPQANWTLNANLTLQNGARLGVLRTRCSTNAPNLCHATINGSLTVQKGAYLWARGGGLTANDIAESSMPRYNRLYSHGGQTSLDPEHNDSYGSILNPTLPGQQGRANDGTSETFGGGALLITVRDTLTLDGDALADANTSDKGNNPMGTGGSINLTCGALQGSGTISASGHPYDTSANYLPENLGQSAIRNATASAAGGRIAIRLTNPGADFTQFPLEHILATGASKGTTTRGHASAGTIYLQTAQDPEAHGTIYLQNPGQSASADTFTPLPSQTHGGEEDNLQKTSLSITQNARAKLFAPLQFKRLDLDETATLDLHGHTLTVETATLRGKTILPGTYPAASLSASLDDTSEALSGNLHILGAATILYIR
ncbi:MAG: DUF2341 domain-containing protein [Kiritimatiellia bacterium]